MNRNQKCVYYFRFVNNNYTGALTLCQMSLTVDGPDRYRLEI